MDQQQIKVCIDAMNASELAEMQFAQDGWTLRLVRRSPDEASASRASAAPTAAKRPAPVPASAATPATALCAPLYGVVHLSPGPGEAPFISIGDTVVTGQVVCVIEAMKVFNQVRAEFDATVAGILVASGAEVEAGQPLMRFA